MNRNRNTPYYFESSAPVMPVENSMSVFNIQAENYVRQTLENRRMTFSNFISSRNYYLNKLKGIGDNWISGNSKQPTEKSIENAKDILNNVGSWYYYGGYEKYLFPKIIMSPTPKGGIGFEFNLNSNVSAFITILDDDINFEVERNGLYAEQDVNKNDINQLMLNLYQER